MVFLGLSFMGSGQGQGINGTLLCSISHMNSSLQRFFFQSECCGCPSGAPWKFKNDCRMLTQCVLRVIRDLMIRRGRMLQFEQACGWIISVSGV